MNSLKLILCLLIALSLLPVVSSSLLILSQFDYDYSLISSELSLMELRELLLYAYDIRIGDNELLFHCKGKEASIGLVNSKLIMKPGTTIIVDEVEEVLFFQRNGNIYLRYKRKNIEYETLIAKEEGICLSDFYRCFDDSDYSDNTDAPLS